VKLRVIAVTGPAWLSLQNRAVIVQREGNILGRIPLEDIAVIVIDGPDVTISHQLLSQSVSHKIAVVIADDKHIPCGLLLPIAGHSTHTAILRSQIAAAKPSLKRTWQTIVKAKVLAQAHLLEDRHLDSKPIRRLLPFVRSGDPDNIEGQAASKYFDLAFGEDFKRQRNAEGINGLLNYGYAVLRAAVARAVVSAGLHPALGIHHQNQYNAFCLADDAMEPLRPLIDWHVLRYLDQANAAEVAVTPKTKRLLIAALGEKVLLQGQESPLLVGLDRYAANLRRAICDGEELHCPIPRFDP
jgi:CRISPR-associated protein Cas1